MADTSLDDFFAKKDKSKKKSKSKMTPSDVLAKADEGPKKVKKKKDKEMPGGLGLNTPEETAAKKQAEDEDWVDYEEKKEVDYTGLRIQTLQMREEEDKDTGESDGDGDGEEGEEGREAASGPWNSVAPAPAQAATSAAAAAAPPPPPPEPEEKKENTAPKKYVPPAQRQAAMQPAAAANPISRRAKKVAPNIQSEEDFPTLGGGPQTSSGSAWGSKKYEDSGAGDIESNPGQRRGVNLSLENKFAALQD